MILYLFKSCDSKSCRESYSILTNRIKQLARVFDAVETSLENKELNIVLSGRSPMQALNKSFRKVDRPTDVLSFPLDSQIYGEIWLCPDVISDNAEQFGEEFERELLRITIHGLLHLAGYDHTGHFVNSPSQKEKMFKLQEQILEMLY